MIVRFLYLVLSLLTLRVKHQCLLARYPSGENFMLGHVGSYSGTLSTNRLMRESGNAFAFVRPEVACQSPHGSSVVDHLIGLWIIT
jgi:hypothetical protein